MIPLLLLGNDEDDGKDEEETQNPCPSLLFALLLIPPIRKGNDKQ